MISYQFQTDKFGKSEFEIKIHPTYEHNMPNLGKEITLIVYKEAYKKFKSCLNFPFPFGINNPNL